MAATDVVSVDAAIASVLSELESISSLKEEQRTLKAFLEGKDVFALLSAGFSKSLIYQLTPIGQNQSTIDGDRQMVYLITCQVFFQSLCPFPNTFQWSLPR